MYGRSAPGSPGHLVTLVQLTQVPVSTIFMFRYLLSRYYI